LQRLLSEENKDVFEVFNIGTGKGTSVLDVIKTFEKTTGISLNYNIVDRRPGDVSAVFADTSKANTVLGWKAERTIEDALASAWEWETSVMCPEGVLCFLSMGPNQLRLTSVAVALADAQDHYQDQHQDQHQDATISNVVNTL
jgi:hypothetical protein